MDWSGYVPLIVAVVTALLGVFAYAYQKRVDRRNGLVELRRATYQELLVNLQRHLRSRSPTTLSDLDVARAKAIVVASDRVARTIGGFFNAANQNKSEMVLKGDVVIVSYAAMVIAMRQDCFEKTQLSEREIVDFAPVIWRGDGAK